MRPIYKFLDIDNHQVIGDQMYNFVTNYTDILAPKTPTFFTDVNITHALTHAPLLKEFLDRQFLVPTKMSVIVVPADMAPYLHVDTADPFVRMLWPVKNTAGSCTKFYDVPRECLELTSYLDGVLFYNITENRDWEQLAEFELSRPLVFDASFAHAVHSAPDATGHRISFSVGFDRDLPISKSVKAWFGFQR